MDRRLVELVVVCLLVSASAGAAGEFTVAVDGSYETPEDTVTVEGDQFTVSSVGVVGAGETMTVRVDAPADERYQINLYTLDQQIQAFRAGSGDETVTFETDSLEPSSYVVAIDDNGEFFAVHPVVVSGYDVTVSVPERAPAGEGFDAEVTIEHRAGDLDPGAVELAVWNGRTRERVGTTRVADGVYRASVPALANGTYRVSGAVIAENRVDGEENPLGVSEPTTLAVDESLDEPVGGPQRPADGDPPDDGSANGSDAGAEAGDDPGSADDSSADDDVISPAANGSSDDGDGAGFGVVVAVLGLAGSALLARRRR